MNGWNSRSRTSAAWPVYNGMFDGSFPGWSAFKTQNAPPPPASQIQATNCEFAVALFESHAERETFTPSY